MNNYKSKKNKSKKKRNKSNWNRKNINILGLSKLMKYNRRDPFLNLPRD